MVAVQLLALIYPKPPIDLSIVPKRNTVLPRAPLSTGQKIFSRFARTMGEGRLQRRRSQPWKGEGRNETKKVTPLGDLGRNHDLLLFPKIGEGR